MKVDFLPKHEIKWFLFLDLKVNVCVSNLAYSDYELSPCRGQTYSLPCSQ